MINNLMKLSNHFVCKSKCNVLLNNVRHFKATTARCIFYEKDDKGGYDTKLKSPSQSQIIKEGFKELKQELRLWKDELKEAVQNDPIYLYNPGETDIVWDFTTQECLDRFVVTTDKDHNEGYSTCNLKLNKHGKGHLYGTLNTEVPKDGKVKRAGYCNIKSARPRKSFKRDAFYDWTQYNMLVLRVRGDGRSYFLNISCKGFFDIMWNDTFHYVLFTRGGPYWQIAKIPFSKFFFSSKGRIQDKQPQIPLEKVTNFGISVADKIGGSYSLEIDYIGVEYNPNLTEESAYEMYKTDNNIAAH